MHRVQPQVSDDVELHCWYDLWENNDVFLNIYNKENVELDKIHKIFTIKEYSHDSEIYSMNPMLIIIQNKYSERKKYNNFFIMQTF